MRRYIQILGLVVLAFAASGWGHVIAAALCPHANPGAAKAVAAVNMAGEYACHSTKPEIAAKPDCHDPSMGQETAADMEPSHAMPGNEGNRAALVALPENVPCTHCMGRTELPASTVIARQNVEPKRSLEPATLQAASPLPLFSFTLPVVYRQGAPPGSSTPKHLLISVLLI
ncbi:MAG TPA: hypothetical protein VGC66_16430 [Pyrinomonadaceae bacterium]|jgi:hypothetical protein